MTPSNQSGQTGSITDTARKAAEDLKETGKDALHGAKSVMGDAMSELKAGATAKAEEVRETIAEEGQRMADSLRDAAGQQTGSMQGRVLETMASGVTAVSDSLRSRDVSTLLSDIQSFAKRNPALFVAGAAAAGLVLARLAAQAGRSDTGSGMSNYSRSGPSTGDMGSGLSQGGMGDDMAGEGMASGMVDDPVGTPSMGGNL